MHDQPATIAAPVDVERAIEDRMLSEPADVCLAARVVVGDDLARLRDEQRRLAADLAKRQGVDAHAAG